MSAARRSRVAFHSTNNQLKEKVMRINVVLLLCVVVFLLAVGFERKPAVTKAATVQNLSSRSEGLTTEEPPKYAGEHSLPGSVNMALLEKDWKTAGDKLLTLDNTTGLEWLDLTQTAALTFNVVSAQLGPGGNFEGFRFATLSEVNGFLAASGLPPTNWTPGNCPGDPSLNAAVTQFQNLVGLSYSDINCTRSSAYTGTDNPSDSSQTIVKAVDICVGESVIQELPVSKSFNPGNFAGSFLVREAETEAVTICHKPGTRAQK